VVSLHQQLASTGVDAVRLCSINLRGKLVGHVILIMSPPPPPLMQSIMAMKKGMLPTVVWTNGRKAMTLLPDIVADLVLSV
jgi:hypothetical protein